MNRRVLLAIAFVVAVVVVIGLIALGGVLWRPSQQEMPVPHTPTLAPPTLTPTPPTSPTLTSRTLRVSVRDAEMLSPVQKADVIIGQQQGSTDDQGVYVLDVPHGVVHSVQVRSLGYEPWQGRVDATVADSKSLSLDVDLEPNTVPGKVTGHNRTPMPDATLLLNGQEMPLDDKGEFRLRRVIVGDVITVEHPGYLSYRTTFAGESALTVALDPISVTISVHDAITEQGVPDVSVCTDGDSCQSTDASGDVTFYGVADGTSFSAQRQGYQMTSVTSNAGDALTVELAPRELHGVIRHAETGSPITNTILFVNGQVAPLGKDGSFHLPDVTEVYSIFVKSPGYQRVTIPIDEGTKTSRYDALDLCLEPDKLPCADIILAPFAVRGIYATYNLLMWDKNRMLELIDLVDRSPVLNAIVVDIKGDFGYLAFESDDPLIAFVNAMASPRLPIPEFLQLCKEKHIYTIARMVIFKDHQLIAARPELAVRHPNGAIFYDREGMAWADPTLEEVWEYNIAITKEAIRLGFDEVQYDYLRFPSDSTSLAVVRALVYSVPSTLESRTAAIQGFVKAHI